MDKIQNSTAYGVLNNKGDHGILWKEMADIVLQW